MMSMQGLQSEHKQAKNLKQGLSVFVICKNEAHIIEQTLKQAAKLADEIVVVDSGSSDGTLELVHQFTQKIFRQEWLGYSKQKNLALSKCEYQWCLSLDADEVLTDEAITEIQSIVQTNDSDQAYRIARKLFIGEEFIRWGGYYPDKQLRLFANGQARFNDREVHESLQAEAGVKIVDLKSPLNHFAYKNLAELEKSFDNYADLASHSKPAKSKGALKASFKYLYTLLNKLILRLGVLQGSMGIKLAFMHASYSYKKYI